MPHELEYVVKDAMMMCDKGALPGTFMPTFNTSTTIYGLLVATEEDKQPEINIPSFGACAVDGQPCMIRPEDWQDTWEIRVNRKETLLFHSKLPCRRGGTVEFITSGQVPLPDEILNELLEEFTEEEDSGGWGFLDWVELVPVVGSAVGAVREGLKGNWKMALLNVGFLAADVLTLGGAAVVTTPAKAGTKVTVKLLLRNAAGKLVPRKFSKNGLKAFMLAVGKKLDDIVKTTRKIGVTACFPAGTKVAVESSQRNIEDLRVGDLVWAMDTTSHVSGLRRVASTMCKEVEATILLTIAEETIETTVNHPIFTQRGYVEAGKLTTEDFLMTRMGLWHQLQKIDFAYTPKEVFNFEVEEWHNYFVGDWEWLVHNTSRPCIMRVDNLPPYLARMEKGRYFNYIRESFYRRMNGFNEVALSKGNRLDSYIPGKEIVSRKWTQLDDIKLRTGKNYIDEIVRKYSPGTRINPTPRNAGAIDEAGSTLQGKMILEVPVQKGSDGYFTSSKLSDLYDYAREADVIIRDTNGKILNP